MTEQTLLDMLQLERFPQQRIAAEIDHARGQVIASPPIGVDVGELILGQYWSQEAHFVAWRAFLIVYYCCDFSHGCTFLLPSGSWTRIRGFGVKGRQSSL